MSSHIGCATGGYGPVAVFFVKISFELNLSTPINLSFEIQSSTNLAGSLSEKASI